MQYYNNILCFPAHLYYHTYSEGLGKGDIVEERYVAYGTYRSQVARGILNIIRQGKGAGNYALIDFASIPPKYRALIRAKYGDLEKTAQHQPFINTIEKDYAAIDYFINYRYPDGSPINTDNIDNIMLWSNNAAILNAVSGAWQSHIKARIKLGKRPLKTPFFANAATFVESEELMIRFPHNLPSNPRRLETKFFEYLKGDYFALIKQYKGNQNRLKIDDNLLQLLAYISALPTRPYSTKVVEYYYSFMRGEVDLVDKASGLVFNPKDYLDKNGEIIELTDAAIRNRLNNPALQAKLGKKLFGSKDFNDKFRPHRHRHSPIYSFSKISMDDRDLIWKDKATKKRVKAYYAYDVASGCRIGSAYSMDKNEELFLDCMRDMFVFADRHDFGMPLEVEVENHLVNKFFDDLRAMFPLVTICAPGNSQEKRAEHLNRAVKYQVEKNNHPGVGRWWLKSKYNRISVDKVDDEFKQKMKVADRMIADDIQDSLEYNNALHPKQNLYPGMTRMQVLVANLNPNLPKINKQYIYRYIGHETDTTIMRSQYVNCQYEKYALPHPSVLELLKPNNLEVQAYWMPNDDGEISEVYLYQHGNYICTCNKLVEYNEAKAERTDADEEAKLAQDKYVSQFDKWIKDGLANYPKLEVVKNDITPLPQPPPDIIEEKEHPPDTASANINYSEKAFDDFLK